MGSKTAKALVLVVGGAAAVGVTLWARHALGIQLDPHSLRDFVERLGPAAPVALILLIAFRSVLGVPSQLALIAAGLCFGTLAGTIYGALGLTASGLGTFLLARYAGRDAVQSRAPASLAPLLERAGDRPGAILVALGTGYPIGFITGYHALAGVTPMRLGVFALALAIGSSCRAATYTFFGNSLVAGGLAPVLQATAVLAIAMALPLLFPGPRGWIKRLVLAR